MAENSSSPVRPPVLDGKARRTTAKPDPKKASDSASAQTATPDTKTQTTASGSKTSTPDPQKPAGNAAHGATTRQSGGQKLAGIVLASVSGAALALVAVGLFASTGLLDRLSPNAETANLQQEAIISQLDGLRGRIANLETSLDGMIGSIAALETESQTRISDVSQSQSGLTSQISTIQSDLETLQADLAASPLSGQVGALISDLDALSTRVDVMASGASSDDAEAFAQMLQDLTRQNQALAEQLAQAEAQRLEFDATLEQLLAENADLNSSLDTSVSQLAQLEQQVDQLLALRDDLQSEQASATLAAKLPLALQNLRSDLDNGQPFAESLAVITDLMPELTVPQSVQDYATSGLLSPAALLEQFQLAVPDALANVPLDAQAGLTDRLSQSLQQLFAVRDSAADSSTPQGLIALTESALDDRDFQTAAMAVETLPEPMRDVFGELPGQILAHRDARDMLINAEESALSPTTDPQGASQ